MSTQQPFYKTLYNNSNNNDEGQTQRSFTPSRLIKTSQSRRQIKHQSTGIPKSLQLELKRQDEKHTFVTEISCNLDQNNYSHGSSLFIQNNFSARNISTAASGSFRNKILQQRKPVSFAIKTFQSASKRLESFFNSTYTQNDQKNKDDELSDVESFKKQMVPGSPKRNIQHGLYKKGTLHKSSMQLNLVQTLSHIPVLLDSLDQIDKEEVQPEEVLLLNNKDRLRKIVKKIDYSKQGNVLAPIMQSKVYESQKYDNQLNFVIQKKQSRLNQLKMQENRIDNPNLKLQIDDLLKEIANLDNQIEEFQKQIHDQEMYLLSKKYMKQVRYKDMELKREENINLLKIINHLSRFLKQETESLITDSKSLDEILNKMVKQHYEKQEEIKRQSIMTQDMENKKSNEMEVDRLINLESKMREYERKDAKNKKRQEYLEKQRIENMELQEIKMQQKEYGGIINNHEEQFQQFHNQNKIASSHLDLLQFCLHVKQSTQNLKHEQEIQQRNVNILKQEVEQLEKELQIYQLQNQFDFDVEECNKSVFSKKQELLNDQILIKNDKQNYNIISIDSIEKDNFNVQRFSEIKKNKVNFAIDLIMLKKKKFNADDLENSIQSFSSSIQSLIKIINDKQERRNIEKSIDIEDLSNNSSAMKNQKYYYTHVNL